MINKCGKISGCICVLCSVTIHAAHAHLYTTVYRYKCSYMTTFSEALIYKNAKRRRQLWPKLSMALADARGGKARLVTQNPRPVIVTCL